MKEENNDKPRFELPNVDVSRDQWLKSKIIEAVREHANFSDKVLTSVRFAWGKSGNGIYIDKMTVQYKDKGKKKVLILT